MIDIPSSAVGPLGLNSHASEYMRTAPRLSLALTSKRTLPRLAAFATDLEKTRSPVALSGPNAPPAGESDDDRVWREARATVDLKDLLGHLQQRLRRGLIEAWTNAYETPFVPEPRSFDDALDATQEDPLWIDLEEAWARAFTEMVVFTKYGGPGQSHGFFQANGLADDRPLFERFPGVFPIAIACQHLSTLSCLSRGFDLARLTLSGSTGCTASAATVSYPLFQGQPQRARSQAGFSAKIPDLMTMSPPLAPGDILMFNDDDQTTLQNPGAHICSVLRVHGHSVQFIDTPGTCHGNQLVTIASKDQVTNAEHLEQGSGIDHAWAEGQVVPGNFVAWAKMPKAHLLATAVARMRAAQPAGYVRLALVDKRGASEGDAVRYVSKLLHMRYPVARFIWALRDLPTTDLTAVFCVYHPTGAWARRLLDQYPVVDSVEGHYVEEAARWVHLAPEIQPPDLAPPASLCPPGEGGALRAASYLVGADENKDGLARIHWVEVTAADKWHVDLDRAGTSLPPTWLSDLKLALPAQPHFTAWCVDARTFGSAYLRLPGMAPGLSDAPTGVPFFDP